MTQYERGVKVERLIQHYYEYYYFYVIASRGSHGLADLIINLDHEMFMVQAKLHPGLREPKREQELKDLKTCEHISKYVAWKYKLKRKVYILFTDLQTGETFTIRPLTKEQEAVYQLRKKLDSKKNKHKKQMSTQ